MEAFKVLARTLAEATAAKESGELKRAFAITTRRYRLDQLQAFAEDPDALVFSASLQDKFTYHGIVSSMAVRQKADSLIVDSWLMSCRVFSRSLERFMMRKLVKQAQSRGARKIVGEYVPTDRNGIVSDLYPRLGFEASGDDGHGLVYEVNGGIKDDLETHIRTGTAGAP